jgi:hypothetical protein
MDSYVKCSLMYRLICIGCSLYLDTFVLLELWVSQLCHCNSFILIYNLRENISVCCSTIVVFICTDHTLLSSQVHRYPNSIWIKWLRLSCQPFLHCLLLLMCHSDVIWALLILWLFRICWSNFSFTYMHIESPPKPRLKLSAHFWNFLQTHKHTIAHVVITVLNCYFFKNKWSQCYS